MEPVKKVSEEYSLPEALDRYHLPVLLNVSTKCILKGELVLDAGQSITVLNRTLVKLLIGKDWEGKTFRMNTNEQASLFVDTIDEMYPTDLSSLKEIISKVTYILSKSTFICKNESIQILEKFTFDPDENFADVSKIRMISFNNKKICLPLTTVLSKSRFVFVHYKETTTLQSLFLQKFQTQKIRFLGAGANLPIGNVEIRELSVYETVLIVSTLRENEDKLKFELFQLDGRIKVFVSDQPIPSYVVQLGKYKSKAFGDKMKEIEFAMHIDIYTPRYFGYVIIDKLKTSTPEKKKNQMNRYSRQGTIPLKPDYVKTMRSWKSCDSIDDMQNAEFNQEDSSNFKPSVWQRMSSRGRIFGYNRQISCQTNSPSIEEAPGFLEEALYKDLKDQDCFKNSDHKDMFDLQNIIYQETGEINIDPEKLIKNQQEILDQANLKKSVQSSQENSVKTGKQQIPKLRNMVIDLKSPLTESDCFARENQLYGFDTLSREINPLSKSPSSVEESNKLSLSLDETQFNKRNKQRRNRQKTMSLYETTYPVLEPQPRGRNNSNERNMDSGIDDSPDTRKSFESIHRIFEGATLSNQGVASVRSEPKSNYETSRKASSRSMLDTDDSPSYNDTGHYQYPKKVDKNRKSKSDSSLSSFDDPEYASLVYSRVVRRPRTFTNEWQKQEIESIEEVSHCNIKQVADILLYLRLEKYVQKFEDQMINGKLLINLSEEALLQLGLNRLETRKIYKYIHGWRVNTINCNENFEEAPNYRWSVNDVQNAMKNIRLHKVGAFTAEHKIDGALLEDLIENNLMQSLEQDYGLQLTLIEYERLRVYMSKELKYNDEVT